jgi:hypothetical protein
MSEWNPDPELVNQWLVLPEGVPEGILDGNDFDIALRYIEGARADSRFYAEDRSQPAHKRAQCSLLCERREIIYAEQEARLLAGDTELASQLAKRVVEQVEEVRSGARLVVTGQACLLRVRRMQTSPPVRFVSPEILEPILH